MVWLRRAKPPGEFLCRFDSCRLRLRVEDRRLNDRGLRVPKPRPLFYFRSSILDLLFSGPVAQMDQSASLRSLRSQVQVLPGPPENCECRIANVESIACDSQFEIRNSRFGMCRRGPTWQRHWS